MNNMNNMNNKGKNLKMYNDNGNMCMINNQMNKYNKNSVLI